MRFIVQFILTLIISATLQVFMPWWIVCISSFFCSLIIFPNNKINAFLGGFVSISCLWMGYAAYLDVQSKSILSTKIFPLFKLSNSISLIILTGFIGGLVSGMFSLSGYFVRKLNDVKPQRKIW